MNESDALRFLKEHQPLPPDSLLSTEVITAFNEVRRFLIDNPVSEALPLLLSSFGDGSGFGIYVLVDDAVAAYPHEMVVQNLIVGLQNPSRSIRYWNADIAARFPDKLLVDPLSRLLSSDDEDLRSAAVIALGGIDEPKVRQLLLLALEIEDSSEVRLLLADTLADSVN